MTRYYAKLLLFGEHVVIKGSQALAIPFRRFEGHWQLPNEASLAASLQQNLPKWLDYLSMTRDSDQSLATLDLERFAQELEQGLYFESNIPTGYGAGSSGALVAAVYDRYALDPISRDNTAGYPQLKMILGQMESFFHGASSGADPLICYVNRPLLFDHQGKIEPVGISPAPEGDAHALFIVDTGIRRQTGPLVQGFLKRCEDRDYENIVLADLIPATENAIALYLHGDRQALFQEWHELSHLQFRYMPEMIPAAWREAWLHGLSAGDFKLKLCGAGGGGFILGIARSLEAARRYFQDYPLYPVT